MKIPMQLFAISLLVIVHAAMARAEQPATQPANTFTGQWNTSFGPMKLTQIGDQISGTYGSGDQLYTITGKLADNHFKFQYREFETTGEGQFELSADGESFEGRWRVTNGPVWQRWKGIRTPGIAQPINTNFTGFWKTTYGKMRLWQEGDSVQGIYDAAGRCTISGKVTADGLIFQYSQPNGEKGTGTFKLSADFLTFTGQWSGQLQNQRATGKWNAQRIIPQPGKVWLIILEQPWENDLQQNPFSFGDMLKAFFARLPSVQVRHKFFNTTDDFQQWCDELSYLAEPVVLHISSHGTTKGIACKNKLLDAKMMADALQYAGDIRLLHFGTCLVAGGDIPADIHRQLGARATFPISGYANTADWGGSAVIDFTLLDFIFERQMTPEQAVRQTLASIRFAGNRIDSVIPPANLVIHLPPARPGELNSDSPRKLKTPTTRLN